MKQTAKFATLQKKPELRELIVPLTLALIFIVVALNLSFLFYEFRRSELVATNTAKVANEMALIKSAAISYTIPLLMISLLFVLIIVFVIYRLLSRGDRWIEIYEHQLKERVKEQVSLYGVSSLVTQLTLSVDEIIDGSLPYIVAGWQYPDSTTVKITINGEEYYSDSKDGFGKAISIQQANIVVNGEVKGSIEVGYTKEVPLEDDGVFLTEERLLIDSLAEIFGQLIIRRGWEDILLEQSNELDVIFENAPQAMILTDISRKVKRLNRKAKELTNSSIGDVLGLSAGRALGCINESKGGYGCGSSEYCKSCKLRKTIESVYQDGERVSGVETPLIVESNGREVKFDFSISATPLKIDGEMLVLVTLEDITHELEVEVQLRQAEKMQAVGQLAGGIAHDFNNQLASIAGFADLLREEVEDQDQLKEYVDAILVGAKRSSDLTSQLLAFSRKGNRQYVQVDIHSTVKEVVEMLARTVNRNIKVKSDLRADVPFTVGDPTQIQNALLNLGINARDSQEHGGEIFYSTDIINLDIDDCHNYQYIVTAGEYLQISVSDKGTGIEESLKQRIFEPFFTTKEQGKGTGMGLAAVYGTVKSHDGFITVDSTLGEGTTFTINLPLDRSAPVESEVEKVMTGYIKGEGHILVVEDEEPIRRVSKRMLESFGYSVTTCGDGVEALDIYESEGDGIDLIILDLIMPIMGGKQTFEELKKMNPHIKVIISSGYSQDGEVQELMDRGVRGFIQKPYVKDDLARVLQEEMKASLSV